MQDRSAKHIMVVDNHPVMRKFMTALLTRKGHEVLAAADGLSAIELLKTRRPDIFFIDLVMPNIAGEKLCKIIRRQNDLKDSFIVVLSAIAMEREVRIEDLGADMILAKSPFDKLGANVDLILRQIETDGGRQLKGQVMGREDLFKRQISKELLASRRHAEATLHHMSEGLMELVDGTKIVYANPAAISIMGKTEQDLLSADFLGFFSPPDQRLVRNRIAEAGRTGLETAMIEELSLNHRLVSTKIIPVPRQNHPSFFLVMLRDITHQKQAEQALIKSQEQYRQENIFLENIFENSADAIAIVDKHGWFTRWNTRAADLLGYSFEEMKKKKAFEFYSNPAERKQVLSLLRKNGSIQNYEINFTGKKGIPIPCAVSISLMHDQSGQTVGSLSILRDLTQWKQAEERLRYLSFHDSLTGLYNRAFFEEEMKRLAQERSLPLGIIVCDINGLKLINDTLGHQKGDELLRAAASALKKCFRSGDIIARIGGDEFAVLLPGSKEKVVQTGIRRIRKEIEKHIVENPEQHLSFSIGHAVGTRLPLDMQALFKKADDLMYVEKFKRTRAGGNPVIQDLINAMGKKDYISQGHVERLQKHCWKMALYLGLTENQARDLQRLARFHDLGKVGIADNILLKPDALTRVESREMKRHCETGHRIALSTPVLAPIADLILKHHEWWNGQGYPLGLQGQDIPLECRILSVAEAYDMMTRHRPHQKAKPREQAIEEIRRGAGTQFDPTVVDAFIQIVSEPE